MPTLANPNAGKSITGSWFMRLVTDPEDPDTERPWRLFRVPDTRSPDPLGTGAEETRIRMFSIQPFVFPLLSTENGVQVWNIAFVGTVIFSEDGKDFRAV